MTSKTIHPATTFIPYRAVLPEGFVCPDPEFRPDGMQQAPIIDECGHLIRDHFADRPDVVVDTGGFVFYKPGDLNVRVRPDLYVAVGVDAAAIRRRNGYVIWEAGKPPDFALEVASESTHGLDTGTKPLVYSRIGIGEYWRFDPTGGELYGYALAGDILVNGVYQPIAVTTGPDGIAWGYSPALDLSLCASFSHWGQRLRFYDAGAGRYLRSIGEERAAHRDERAAHGETRAELERLRAEARRLQGE